VKGVNKFLIAITAVLIVAGIAFGAYYLGQNKEENITPVFTPTAVNISESPTTTAPTATPKLISDNKEAAVESIKAAVAVKDYAALESYMAPQVSVTLYASECCGVLSKSEAGQQMAYLSNGTPPWDFSEVNTIIQKLILADPVNFKDRIIGVASNDLTVSFSLNSENRIDKIFIVVDYKLIAP